MSVGSFASEKAEDPEKPLLRHFGWLTKIHEEASGGFEGTKNKAKF